MYVVGLGTLRETFHWRLSNCASNEKFAEWGTPMIEVEMMFREAPRDRPVG